MNTWYYEPSNILQSKLFSTKLGCQKIKPNLWIRPIVMYVYGSETWALCETDSSDIWEKVLKKISGARIAETTRERRIRNDTTMLKTKYFWKKWPGEIFKWNGRAWRKWDRHSSSTGYGMEFTVECDQDVDGKLKFEKSCLTRGADRKENGHGEVPWGMERITRSWRDGHDRAQMPRREEEADGKKIRSVGTRKIWK